MKISLRQVGGDVMTTTCSGFDAIKPLQAVCHSRGVTRPGDIFTTSEEVVLNVDHRQGGLGNGSCGPGVLPQYQLTPGEFRFQVRFAPVTGKE